MGLTPLDIHNKEFKKSLVRGYDPDEVDDFLDQVIREFEILIRENNSMREQVEQLQARVEIYRHQEEAINQVLVVAQATAEDMKQNAKHEAGLILQEARLEAERLMASGHMKARQIIEENGDLLRMAQVLRTQVRIMLKAQLESLDAGLAQTDQFEAAVQGIRQAAVSRQPSEPSA